MCAIAFDFYSVLLQALIFITLNTIGFIKGSKTVGMITLGEWMKQEFPDTDVAHINLIIVPVALLLRFHCYLSNKKSAFIES